MCKPIQAPVMKPDEDQQEATVEEVIAGDVIGDTVYSERFVLKLLLKFANLDTLKEEINDKALEDDLCTLWDMTADRDVVLFLLKHEALKLVGFTLPIIESPRILEIVIGIVANMCCQKEGVEEIMMNEMILSSLLDYIKSDDSLVLIQVLRYVNSCLFLAKASDIGIWMDLFSKIEYSDTLYFILKNSTNKDLLINAIENLNTVCCYCNTENLRSSFFSQFIKSDAVEGLRASFNELTIVQVGSCETDELERVMIITMQIILTFVGFECVSKLNSEFQDTVESVLEITFEYYKTKFEENSIDTDLKDLLDSASTIMEKLSLSQHSNTQKILQPVYTMWKKLYIKKTSNESSFEDALPDFAFDLKNPLSILICQCIIQCTEENWSKAMDKLNPDFDCIIADVDNDVLKKALSKRIADYKSSIGER